MFKVSFHCFVCAIISQPRFFINGVRVRVCVRVDSYDAMRSFIAPRFKCIEDAYILIETTSSFEKSYLKKAPHRRPSIEGNDVTRK